MINVKMYNRKDEIVRLIKDRLNDDWCIIEGQLDLLIRIENAVYPPGTKKNADYVMTGFPHTVYMGKKTSDLEAFCNHPPDFDSVLLIKFIDVGDNKLAMQLVGYYEDEKRDCVINLSRDAGNKIWREL